MIARHDLVLGLCLSVSLCHCLYFLTSLPNLLILCVSLFFYALSTAPPHFLFTLNLSTSFFFCHLFIVFLHLLPQHCLHPFRLPLFCLCVTHPPSLPCMHSLFLNLSLFHSLLLFFSVLTPSPPPLSLSLPLPSSPCFYSSLPAPRVPRRETSRAVVPAEQLPCKAIQIEMFAENNMCVITA